MENKKGFSDIIVLVVMFIFTTGLLYFCHPLVFPDKSNPEDWKTVEGTLEFAEKGRSRGKDYFEIKTSEHEEILFFGHDVLEYFDYEKFGQEVSKGNRVFFLVEKIPSGIFSFGEPDSRHRPGEIWTKETVYLRLEDYDKAREFLLFKIFYWGAILCNVIFVFGIFGIIYFPKKMYPNQGEKGTEE